MNSCLFVPAKITPLQFKSSTSSCQKIQLKHPNLEFFKHRLIRFVQKGHLEDALSTLNLMTQQGVSPDLLTYSVILKSCIRRRDFDRGKLIHALLVKSGLEFDAVAINSLISLYSKCGDSETANKIFDAMGNEKDLVSWSAMISCFAHNNCEFEAIILFNRMVSESVQFPNEFCFAGVIRACSSKENASVGTAIFGFVIKTGFLDSDLCVGSALIDLFAKSGDLVSARKVFDGMPERNVVVWTLMITRYTQCGLANDAANLFIDMVLSGFEPDRFTLSSVISACAELGSFQLGQQLHSQAICIGLSSDVCVGCSLVDMYAKCSGDRPVHDLRKVFDQMPEHNVMSWTAIISGHVQNGGCDKEAIELFCEMKQEGVLPNHFTFSSVLKACANLSDSVMGDQVYTHVVKSGLASVNCVGNSFISMYVRSGKMEASVKAFDVLLEKNLISYNAMVDGYAKNSKFEEAFEFFHRINNTGIGLSSFTFASLLSTAASIGFMGKGQQIHSRLLKAGFESDLCISNALISMYSRCGNIHDACRVFSEMNVRNVISWTSMITGFAKHGYAMRALELFREMVMAGVKPNEVTYVAALSACSHTGFVSEGWKYFYSMKNDHGLIPRMEHYACMVDMLGRSGYLYEAVDFISVMPFKADALVWRTLLGACIIHGNMELGEKASRSILELEPHDPAAYVLLSNLYAAVGRWDAVTEIRRNMKEKNLTKEAGCSWIEIDTNVHKFYVGDTSHPRAREIFEKLDELALEIKGLGYVPNTNLVLHDIEEELKEQYLFQHSEKIAVAFGLISTSASRPIRIFKNLRVCVDCHTAIKFISVATGREIVVRDSNRFHHIKEGVCSCGEYW